MVDPGAGRSHPGPSGWDRVLVGQSPGLPWGGWVPEEPRLGFVSTQNCGCSTPSLGVSRCRGEGRTPRVPRTVRTTMVTAEGPWDRPQVSLSWSGAPRDV